MTVNSISFDNSFSLQEGISQPNQKLADQIYSAMQRPKAFQKTGRWKKEVSALSPQQLKQTLEIICQKDDSIESMDRLAQFIPLEKIEETIRFQYPNQADGLQTVRSMLKEAERYLEAQQPIFLFPKTPLTKVRDAIYSCLDGLTRLFGLDTVLEASEGGGNKKGEAIVKMISLFSMISSLLIPLAGAGVVAWVLGSVIFLVSLLSFIYLYLRPPAQELPYGQNWTHLLREGCFSATPAGKGSLDHLVQALTSNGRPITHPLLIERSAEGKLETLKALTLAIEQGKYPQLKGKKIIYFKGEGLDQPQLVQISKVMGRHRQKYILLFDGISDGLKKELKPMLATNHPKFPYVIATATPERINELRGEALLQNLKQIEIQNPETKETLQLLSEALLREAPDALLEKGALDHLEKRSRAVFKEVSATPFIPLKILTKCILATAESQPLSIERQVEAVRSEIHSLSSQSALESLEEARDLNERISSLEAQLLFLEANLRKEKNDVRALFDQKKRRGDIKKIMMERICHAAKIKHLGSRNKKELTATLLLRYFKEPSIERNIRREADRLGANVVITQNLVDRIISENQ